MICFAIWSIGRIIIYFLQTVVLMLFLIIFTARISNVVVLTTDYVFYYVMYVIKQNSVLNEHNMNKECYILLISANFYLLIQTSCTFK